MNKIKNVNVCLNVCYSVNNLKNTCLLGVVVTSSIYLLLLWRAIPTEVKQPDYGYRKINNLIEISSSSLESRFSNLLTYKCEFNNSYNVQIKWNNKYWQSVKGTDVYLYKAYYDVRTKFDDHSYHYVRILASLKKNNDEIRSLFCHLWIKENSTDRIIVVEGETLEIWLDRWNRNYNNNNQTYHAFLFSCPIPRSVVLNHMQVSYVSVSFEKCNNLSNKLPIKHSDMKKFVNHSKEKFVVCVKNLNFLNDISQRFIEWIEFNFVLGVNKIVFYVYEVHPNIMKILDYYSKYKSVEVVTLTLAGDQPNSSENRTKYLTEQLWQKRRNELISYNDCLYSNMYDYEMIVPLDIDELLLPNLRFTWRQMLDDFMRAEPNAGEKYASLSVGNAYFFEYFGNEKSKTVSIDSEFSPNFFHMLSHRERAANSSKPGHSVKSFVFTNVTKTTFNHYALHTLLLKTITNKNIPISLVQMNHYKNKCPKEFDKQCNQFNKYKSIDNIVDKYKVTLIEKIENVIRKLNL